MCAQYERTYQNTADVEKEHLKECRKERILKIKEAISFYLGEDFSLDLFIANTSEAIVLYIAICSDFGTEDSTRYELINEYCGYMTNIEPLTAKKYSDLNKKKEQIIKKSELKNIKLEDLVLFLPRVPHVIDTQDFSELNNSNMKESKEEGVTVSDDEEDFNVSIVEQTLLWKAAQVIVRLTYGKCDNNLLLIMIILSKTAAGMGILRDPQKRIFDIFNIMPEMFMSCMLEMKKLVFSDKTSSANIYTALIQILKRDRMYIEAPQAFFDMNPIEKKTYKRSDVNSRKNVFNVLHRYFSEIRENNFSKLFSLFCLFCSGENEAVPLFIDITPKEWKKFVGNKKYLERGANIGVPEHAAAQNRTLNQETIWIEIMLGIMDSSLCKTLSNTSKERATEIFKMMKQNLKTSSANDSFDKIDENKNNADQLIGMIIGGLVGLVPNREISRSAISKTSDVTELHKIISKTAENMHSIQKTIEPDNKTSMIIYLLVCFDALLDGTDLFPKGSKPSEVEGRG